MIETPARPHKGTDAETLNNQLVDANRRLDPVRLREVLAIARDHASRNGVGVRYVDLSATSANTDHDEVAAA